MPTWNTVYLLEFWAETFSWKLSIKSTKAYMHAKNSHSWTVLNSHDICRVASSHVFHCSEIKAALKLQQAIKVTHRETRWKLHINTKNHNEIQELVNCFEEFEEFAETERIRWTHWQEESLQETYQQRKKKEHLCFTSRKNLLLEIVPFLQASNRACWKALNSQNRRRTRYE